MQTSVAGPVTECMNCQTKIEMCKMREHSKMCGGGPSHERCVVTNFCTLLSKTICMYLLIRLNNWL